MERIESQIADSQKLAKQILSWITCAVRPITTLELQYALAVEVSESEFDTENLSDVEDIISVCAGLVTVDEQSDIIRLVHYTTQEYFKRTQKHWFPNAQTDMAATSVTYLSFDIFKTGFCLTDEEFEERLQLNPLYDYAARNWGHHARAASTEVEWVKMEQLILSFLESEAKVSACIQAMMASKEYLSNSGYSQRVPRQMTGIHLAAYFGLKEVITALLKNGYDPESKDSYIRTALSYAAEKGHDEVVKLLLEKDGIDLNSKSTNSQTALSYAAWNGHNEVVKLLVKKDGIDLNSKDTLGNQTALSYAAEKGHDTVVKLLLEKDGIDLNSKDTYGQTALSYAAWKGDDTVVQLLLEKGAESSQELDVARSCTWGS